MLRMLNSPSDRSVLGSIRKASSSVIYHSIRASRRPGVSDEQIQVALDRWHKMAQEIPVIESYCIGRDIGGNFEFGAVFVLKDIAAYEEFIMHPAGRETDLIGLPLLQGIVALDITDDDDPEIAAKIDDVNRRRYERDPDILELLTNMAEFSGTGVNPV